MQRGPDTFDVLTEARRVLFRDRSGCAAAWARAINECFDAELTAADGGIDGTRVPEVGSETQTGVDDEANGVYYPHPVTSFKVKRKDGAKVFVNICSHPVIGPEEYILKMHPTPEVLIKKIIK